MSQPIRSKLAVLGSPIAHSLSPAIHRAAYEALGYSWTYEAAEVTGSDLDRYVLSLDESWRGLSLTMPLKRDILPLLDHRDALVESTGAANTVLLTDDGVHGFNTDVHGVVQSFRDAGVFDLECVHILGGGATAASVIAGVSQLGADRVVVSVRTPGKAGDLVALGNRSGIAVTVCGWGDLDRSDAVPDAVISTVPGGTGGPSFTEAIRSSALLFDVAYDPWPTPLARAWTAVGGRVISGVDLLINQAVGQIRIFAAGNPSTPLPGEATVVAAMRAAVWKD